MGLRTVTVTASASNLPSTARANPIPEGLHQLVLLVRGHVLDDLEDPLVVERVGDAIGPTGPRQVALDLDVEEHGPADPALGGGHTQRRGDLDSLEKDGVGQAEGLRRQSSSPR